MQQMVLEGVNDGKPIPICKIKVRGFGQIAKLNSLTPQEQLAQAPKLILLAALLSAPKGSLTITSDSPYFLSTLELWCDEAELEQMDEFTDKFMEINKAFLSKMANRERVKSPVIPTALPSDIPSQSSSPTTTSNTSTK